LGGSLRAGIDTPGGKEEGREVSFAVAADREWLRTLSRFPYGMSPEVERRLLAVHGEKRIGELGRGPGESGAGDRVEGFVRAVERATRSYRDRRTAIRHGYRKIGPDFPGMGEHWVNPGLVASGTVDAARPPILTYVAVGDTVRLTGAAFAVPLAADEEPPEAPVGRDAWHDHSASLDEETLVLESARSMHPEADGPRLAMFHTWLWPPNPDGPLAQNNWALSWARLGLDPPGRPDPVVARALFLGYGGDDYYRRLLARAGGIEGRADVRAVDEAVQRGAQRVRAAATRDSGTRRLTAGQEDALRAAWASLWADLHRDLSRPVWERLAPVFREWSGE
ncbi:MAG TPA: hypothetical protein VE173_08920, partial [Longimicrobiales bacterium]|nr:hypothetical protein [Longimicrobiales bacterium]